MKLVSIAVLLSATGAAADTYKGLGADSVSAADVAKFAAPPLDQNVSRKIQAMLDVRGSGAGLITAKGDRMIYATRVTGAAQIWRQDGPMKFAVQLTGGEDRTAPVALTPDDKTVIVSRDIGGAENPGLYLLPIDGGPMKVVQHTPKVKTEFGYVTEDGKSLYFTANDVNDSSYAIYRYDIAAGKRELVFDTPGLWSIADHDKTSWLLVKQIGNAQNEVFVYTLATKKLEPLLGQGEVEEFEVRFGAKAGQVLVRTDKIGDFQRVYTLDTTAKEKKLVAITPEMKHDVSGFTIDQAKARIYYSVADDGYARVSAVDAKSLKALALPKLAAADNVRVESLSRDGRYVELGVDGSQLAPTTMMYDWQSGKLVAWRVPMAPEIDTKTFAKATLESYPARDGTKIPMFVWRPSAPCTGPCPVVVNFHGGPEGQSVAGFNASAQMYVDAGFVFVQPNVRGSTGYGKTWLHADDGAKRLAVITDIEDAAKYIRANWGAGGKAPKVGVSGGSYGGYSTLMAMTYFAGAFDAGVSNVGIANLTTFLTNTAGYRRALRESEYGSLTKDKDTLVKLSPMTYITKLAAPLLVIQGVNDPRVPVGEALQIYKAAESRKVASGLILFPDEGHGAAKRSNIVLTIGHSIAFFQKHLK